MRKVGIQMLQMPRKQSKALPWSWLCCRNLIFLGIKFQGSSESRFTLQQHSPGITIA